MKDNKLVQLRLIKEEYELYLFLAKRKGHGSIQNLIKSLLYYDLMQSIMIDGEIEKEYKNFRKNYLERRN